MEEGTHGVAPSSWAARLVRHKADALLVPAAVREAEGEGRAAATAGGAGLVARAMVAGARRAAAQRAVAQEAAAVAVLTRGT